MNTKAILLGLSPFAIFLGCEVSNAFGDPPCYVVVEKHCDDQPNQRCDLNNCRKVGESCTEIDTDYDGLPDTTMCTNVYRCSFMEDANNDGIDEEYFYKESVNPAPFWVDCMEVSSAQFDLQNGDIISITDVGFEHKGNSRDLNSSGAIEPEGTNQGNLERGISYCWQIGQCPINGCAEVTEDPPVAFCDDSPQGSWADDTPTKKDGDLCWTDGTGRCFAEYYYYYYY